MVQLTPVNYDPFAPAAPEPTSPNLIEVTRPIAPNARLTPVDYDPFAPLPDTGVTVPPGQGFIPPGEMNPQSPPQPSFMQRILQHVPPDLTNPNFTDAERARILPQVVEAWRNTLLGESVTSIQASQYKDPAKLSRMPLQPSPLSMQQPIGRSALDIASARARGEVVDPPTVPAPVQPQPNIYGTMSPDQQTATALDFDRDQRATAAQRQKEKQAVADLPSWDNNPRTGAIDLLSNLIGGVGSPETIVGPTKAMMTGKSLLGKVGTGAGINAGVAGVTDPIVQQGQINRGERKEHDWKETAFTVLLNAALGGTLSGLGHLFQAKPKPDGAPPEVRAPVEPPRPVDPSSQLPPPEPPRGPAPEQPRPRPEQPQATPQPEADAAFRQWQEDVRARAEQYRAQREQEFRDRGFDRQEAPKQEPPQPKADTARNGNRAQPPDQTGTYKVDDAGHVLSERGDAIVFGDQKQAAAWLRKNQDGPQLFDIATHPTATRKGARADSSIGLFTVKQRGLREAPQPPRQESPPLTPEPQRAAEPVSPIEPARAPVEPPRAAEPARPAEPSVAPVKPDIQPVKPPKAEPAATPSQRELAIHKAIDAQRRKVDAAASRAATIKNKEPVDPWAPGPAPKKPGTIDMILSSSSRDKRGIRPDGNEGELRDAGAFRIPGLINRNSKNTIEDWKQILQEKANGHFHPDATDDDVIAAIAREIASKRSPESKTYSAIDKAEIDAHATHEQNWRQTIDAAERLGVARDGHTQESWTKAIRRADKRDDTLRAHAERHGIDTAGKDFAAIQAEVKAAVREQRANEAIDRAEADAMRNIDDIEPQVRADENEFDIPFEDAPHGRQQGETRIDAGAAQAPADRAEPAARDTGAVRGKQADNRQGADDPGGADRRPGGRDADDEGAAVDRGVQRDDARSIDQTDQGEQRVFKGAEKITDREFVERKMEGRQKPTARQKAPDEGLFDTGARNQSEMFDAAPKVDKAEPKPDAAKADDASDFLREARSTFSANPFGNFSLLRHMGPEAVVAATSGFVGEYLETGQIGFSMKWALAGAMATIGTMRVPIKGKTILGKGSHAADALGKTPNLIKDVPGLRHFHPTNGIHEDLWAKIAQMRVAERNWRGDAAKMAKEVSAKFTQAERNLMSDWIERGDLAKHGEGGFRYADERVRAQADQLSQHADFMGQQLVDTGMLDKAAYEALKGQYLHRYYTGKLAQDKDAYRAVQKKISGTWARRRGEEKTLTPKDAKLYKAGDELRAMTKIDTGTTRYVKAGDTTRISALEAEGYVQGKVWKIDSIEGGKLYTHRDYTPFERRAMGEIRDANYRFARGTMEASRDLALGRMFKDIAQDSRWASASDNVGRANNWVQVPDAKVTGTSLKKFGALGGMWVHPDVMTALNVARKPWTNTDSEAWNKISRGYLKALGVWKIGKTAYNPSTHFNNIMGNVSLSALTGEVGPADLVRAWKAMRSKGPAIDEARKAGLQLDVEINLGDEIKLLEKELAGLGMHDTRGGWTRAIDFFLNNKVTRGYQNEDSIFKVASYMAHRKKGLSPEQSVKAAHRLFFDYADAPLGVQAMRDTVSPFISYTYKVAPVMARLALEQPHRMIAAFGLLSAMSIGSYGLLYPDNPGANEDYERANLPTQLQGRNAVGTPRALRLPWNSTDPKTGKPMAEFINTRYFMPGGDLLSSAANGNIGPSIWPQAISANILGGNPFLNTMYGLAAGKDPYFGKDIYPFPDTSLFDWGKRPASEIFANAKAAAKFVGYQALPPSTLWSMDKFGNAAVGDKLIDKNSGFADFMGWTGTDYVGRDQSAMRATAQFLGLKVNAFEMGEQEAIKQIELKQSVGKARQANRASMRNETKTESERDARAQSLYDRIDRRADEMSKIDALRRAAGR